MFYINYQDDKISSVVDTKDLVEEYYTNAQIDEFRKAGITVLTQEDQMGMLEVAKYYLRLLRNIKTKDKKIVSNILTYAEGHISTEDNVNLYAVKDVTALWQYNQALWSLRNITRDNTISHKDLNSELLNRVRNLMNFIDRVYTEPMYTWGCLSKSECAYFVKRLRQYEASMCKYCKLQFNWLSDWVILSFTIMIWVEE